MPATRLVQSRDDPGPAVASSWKTGIMDGWPWQPVLRCKQNEYTASRGAFPFGCGKAGRLPSGACAVSAASGQGMPQTWSKTIPQLSVSSAQKQRRFRLLPVDPSKVRLPRLRYWALQGSQLLGTMDVTLAKAVTTKRGKWKYRAGIGASAPIAWWSAQKGRALFVWPLAVRHCSLCG